MVLFTLVYVIGNRLLDISPVGEIELVVTFWTGNCLISYWSLSGKALHYKDPGLTLLFIGWSILFVSLSILLSPELRFVMMLAYLALLPFGVLGMGWRPFIATCFGVAGIYLSLIFYFRNSGYELADWRLELLVSLSFVLTALAIGLIGREMVLLRQASSKKSREIKAALARIEELSLRDDITGLINRRSFVRALTGEKALHNREGKAFVVALIDVDQLESLRENNGEWSTETVMSELGQLMLACVREVDQVASLAVGHFGVLLTGAHLLGGSQVIERIREAIEHSRFDNNTVQLTVSVGMVEYRPPESIERLLDRAGYQASTAQQQGGNRLAADDAAG
ncbi:GGDEF domain-containing protein [Oceanobacter mangrovi]|uniref:GGDEF domain-containing protein n=1 Tax=Oceanobacter mangrovi TaxID=2862510 RepID=UPI001FE4C429|nr:GGDEF domain-containing protein [Oceanobacter mangrovi]